jgi:DNA-binding CsgD family transcriptional regulator
VNAEDVENSGIQKVLRALLLIQLKELTESEQVPLLIRAGWNNKEIAVALGVTENSIAIKRTRLKNGVKGRESNV